MANEGFISHRAPEEDVDALGHAYVVESAPQSIRVTVFVPSRESDGERLTRERVERLYEPTADKDHPDDARTWVRDWRVGHTRIALPSIAPSWTDWPAFGWIQARVKT